MTMSSYIEDALVGDERIIHQGRLSLWSVWHLLALGLVLLPAFGLGLVFLIIAYVRIRSTELAVTSKRLIVKHGFIRRSTIEINLGKVESIQVDQEILGRMFNFGKPKTPGDWIVHIAGAYSQYSLVWWMLRLYVL